MWRRPSWAQAARHFRLSESGASARLRLRLSGRLAGPPGAEAERPQAEPAGPPRARASGSLWVAQGPGRSVDRYRSALGCRTSQPLAAASDAGPGADSFRPPSAGPLLDADQAQAPTCVAWWPRRRPGWPLPLPLPVMGLKATCIPLSSLSYFGANGFSALATDSATYVGSRRPRNLLFSRRSQPTPLSLSEVEAAQARPQAGASQPPSAPSKRPTRSAPASSQP